MAGLDACARRCLERAGAAAATVLIRLATLWFASAIALIGLAVDSGSARKVQRVVSRSRRGALRLR